MGRIKTFLFINKMTFCVSWGISHAPATVLNVESHFLIPSRVQLPLIRLNIYTQRRHYIDLLCVHHF